MVLLLLEVIIMAVLIVYGLNVAGALGGGIFSVFGLLMMIFVFHLAPGEIPINAVLIILSIAIAGGTLEVTGGIDYLVCLAGKVIKRYPKSVTFVSPLIIFVFCFGIGTSNIALSLEPIIAQTAFGAHVRPKRPLIASVFAANMAILCSPAAASTAYIISLLVGRGVSMHEYLMVTIPTALISILCLSTFMSLSGSHKITDHDFLAQKDTVEMKQVEAKNSKDFSNKTKLSVIIFLIGIFCILSLGIFPETGPHFNIAGKVVTLTMVNIVQLFMYSSAALNVFFTKIDYHKIFTSKISKSAFGAAFAVLGPGWLGSTIFSNPNNLAAIKGLVGGLIEDANWVMIPVIMIVAMLCMSQAATAAIVLPLALSLGVAPLFIAGVVQAINFNFAIPAQPTILFAEDLDVTGDTKKYGFFIPGLFAILVSFVIGTFMTTLV